MVKKAEYHDVYREFLDNDHILLDKEYLSNSHKMDAINKDGYYVQKSLADIRNKRESKIFHAHNKYTIKNIRTWINKNNFNFKLKSNVYIDIKSKLLFETNEGYLFTISLDGLLGNKGKYWLYHKSNPYTIYNIKLFLKINNIPLKLISDKYIRTDKNLIWECENNHRMEIPWNRVQQGQECHDCTMEKIKEKLKMSILEVKQIFIDCGYKPLFEECINQKQKLKAKDKDGYLIYTDTDSLKSNGTSSIFHKSNIYTIYNIDLYLKINKIPYTLISREYPGNKLDMEWRCDNGHYFKMSWDHFLQGARCLDCHIESYSGNKHPNYNPNKTDEERMLGRYQLYGESQEKWRIGVFIRDNRLCQCCFTKSNKINAHHINGYNWAIDERFDVNNGVTLCENCHKLFHKLYGRGGNTKQQYIEFIERYNTTEIKDQTTNIKFNTYENKTLIPP